MTALVSPTGRKAEHLRLAAGPGVEHRAGSGLAAVRLRHRALPGRDLAAVDLTTDLLGARLAAPLVVSAMTGGTPEAEAVNRRLARAAAEHGIALVLGSGRALLGDPELLRTYRSSARPPLLLANLGAVQLADRDAAPRLVDLLGADGLSIHLNPIQEAVQPEGQPHFGRVIERIAATVARLAPLPVVVKEVGFGMDGADVAELRYAGVAAVDVAGAGGTNWALVEGLRDPAAGAVAEGFADWGVPTAEAIAQARAAAPALPLIASGGVRDGVDVARCLALGANAAGLARPLLIAAQEERAGEAVAVLVRQLQIATWAAGAAHCGDLGPEHVR
ncbi:MAG: type 2 isopentenyl-diphosphate Delta-isomerase [Gemmatimonadaceae bacterium]|nr:type 2 isopentenyl-diphosphate Delta-isomerase [Gemmatimonadaceae bacterium]